VDLLGQYDVKVFHFVKVVTPMYSTLILFLSMDPYLMYLSHFGHLLSNMFLQMLTQCHASRDNLIVLEVVHVGIGHILQGTYGLFMHAWTVNVYAIIIVLCIS
jgi:hypothetical protein